MKTTFVKIWFKNLLSYGNKVTEIDLENPGINWVSGKNGKGKSTMIEALCFVLNGKTFRDIKLKELINRKNKKGLEVGIEFYTDDVHYRIIRGLKPNILKIERNHKPVEMRSSKKLIQEDIDKMVGVNYTVFKNAISLALSHSSPFLAMGTGDKRKTVEQMFGISIFTEMTKYVKNDISETKTELQIKQNEIESKKSVIESLNTQMENYEETLKDFKIKKDEEIAEVEEQIEAIDEEIVKILNFSKKLAEEYEKIEDDNHDHDEEIEKYQSHLGKINGLISNINDKVEFFENNSVCGHCNSKIDSSASKENIHKCNVSLKEHSEELNKISEELNKSKDKKKEASKLANKKYKIKEMINTKKSQYGIAKEKKKTAMSKKSYVEEKEFNVDMSSVKKMLETNKKDFASLEKEFNEGSNRFTAMKTITDILSDDGIKTFFLKKIVPVFNTKVNGYIDKFELPVTVEFDYTFAEKITDTVGNEISYMAFSEGEKKRIDISIMLSFIETMKAVNNWNCNLIFFDELFDNAVDQDNLNNIINSIQNIINESPDLCVYLISHRKPETLKYTRKLNVTQESGFSKIELESGNILNEINYEG